VLDTYRDVERLLATAEAQVGLGGRCYPENLEAERARLLGAHGRGEPLVPQFRYGAPADLAELRRTLIRAARALAEDGGVLAGLYAERCLELELEAELAEHVGSPDFSERARRRHGPQSDADWALAEHDSAAWAALSPAADESRRALSDDVQDPASLWCLLERQLGALKLPFRVEASERLLAHAATGNGVVYVKRGVRLSEQHARRIVEHELQGHVLPRARAAAERCGLLRVGSARASDDEEGRALLCEQRAGLLDASRRRELGLRHQSGLMLIAGADWTECVQKLAGFACSAPEALAVLSRVGRGGGLCRELVYLPALRRAQRTLESEPELERWLLRGRSSWQAARALTLLEARSAL
jgi:hypothetical protein